MAPAAHHQRQIDLAALARTGAAAVGLAAAAGAAVGVGLITNGESTEM